MEPWPAIQATVLPDLRPQVDLLGPGLAAWAWGDFHLQAGLEVWALEVQDDGPVVQDASAGGGLGGNSSATGGQASAPTGGAFGGIGGFGAPRNPRGNDESSDPSEIGAAEILKDAALPTAPARLPGGTTYYIYPVTFEVELNQSGPSPSSEFDGYSSNEKKAWNGDQA